MSDDGHPWDLSQAERPTAGTEPSRCRWMISRRRPRHRTSRTARLSEQLDQATADADQLLPPSRERDHAPVATPPARRAGPRRHEAREGPRLRDGGSIGTMHSARATPRVPHTCHTPRRPAVIHGYSRGLASQRPGPPSPQVTWHTVLPIFQAGHAGSIPVARSKEPQVRGYFLRRSQLVSTWRARSVPDRLDLCRCVLLGL